MRMHHMRHAALATPIRCGAAGEPIHGIDVDDVEIRDRIPKSTPHSWRKHVPRWFTPSTEISNFDSLIQNRPVEWNFQMPKAVHIAGINRDLVPLPHEFPREFRTSNRWSALTRR